MSQGPAFKGQYYTVIGSHTLINLGSCLAGGMRGRGPQIAAEGSARMPDAVDDEHGAQRDGRV